MPCHVPRRGAGTALANDLAMADSEVAMIEQSDAEPLAAPPFGGRKSAPTHQSAAVRRRPGSWRAGTDAWRNRRQMARPRADASAAHPSPPIAAAGPSDAA